MFPLIFEVTVHRVRDTGARDSFGTPIKESTTESVKVFGWALGGADAPGDITPERVEYDATLYPPSSVDLVDGDRVELPNAGMFEVSGPPENYDNNPWFMPGMSVVRLKRVAG
ncbi:MAG: hypothetical protein WAN89_02765 [Lawsonella sp.]